MFSLGWQGSIHWRLSSVEQASLFFEKVQLDFHVADLAVELLLLRVGFRPRRTGGLGDKNLRQQLQSLALPTGNQIGVDARACT